MTKQEILDLITSTIFENTSEDITAIELKAILDALTDGYIESGTLDNYLKLIGGTVTGNVFLDVDDEQGLIVRNLAGDANLVEIWNATSAEGYIAVKHASSGEYIHLNPEKIGFHNNTFILNLRSDALTGNVNILIPASSGTLALLSDIATALGSYLPLAGGTMSGNIDMDTNTIVINGVSSIYGGTKNTYIKNTWSGGTFVDIGSGIFRVHGSPDATGNSMEFNTAGDPSLLFFRVLDGFAGNLTHEVMTSSHLWTLPDATGIIALTTDLGAYLPLEGGTMTGNILLSDSVSINAVNGGGYLNLRSYDTDGIVVLSNDGEALANAYLYIENGYAELSVQTAGGQVSVGPLESKITLNAGDSAWTAEDTINLNVGILGTTGRFAARIITKDVIVAGSTRDAGGLGIGYTPDPVNDKFGVLINSVYSGILQGVVGSTIISSDPLGMTAKTSYTTYINQLSFGQLSGVLDGILKRETLTADRTWTLPNKDGTVAMLSDIPSLSGYVSGSGTAGYLTKWTGTSTQGDSQILDNGTEMAIGTSIGSNIKFQILTTTNGYALSAQTNKVGSTTQAGILGTSGGAGTGQNIGVSATAANNTVLNIGVSGSASSAATKNLGASFSASGATDNYSIKLVDGTQGVGKFLKCILSTGESNWASILTTDVLEGSNLYYTNARAIASLLTSYSSGAGTVTASDSIIQAIQKLDGNITAKNSDWNTIAVTRTSTSTFTVTDNATNQEAFKAGRALKYKVNGVNTYRYGQVSSYVTGTVTIIGYELTASIEEMNWGLSSKVVTETITVSGAYADGITNTLILDDNASYTRWKNTKARLVGIDAINVTAETGATKPVINVKNGAGNSIFGTGITITAASTWYSGGVSIETAVGTHYEINRNDSYELAVTTAGTNGTALDLTVVLIFILE